MKATNIDNKGKIRKNKDILPGDCIFPFKYKGKEYNGCVEGITGNWCATNLTSRKTPKTWGYCQNIIEEKTSSKKSSSKLSSKKTVKKPRGRPPKGKRWDYKKNKWVDMCWGCLTDQPNQLAHMEPGGCLCQETDSSDISSSKSSFRKSTLKSSSTKNSRKSTLKSSSTKSSSRKSTSSSIGEILTFGKHNGKTFEWVYENDTQYCDWAIDQGPETPEFKKFRKYCKEKKTNNENIPINELIVSELNLLKQKETVSKNWFKVRAYNTAIKVIKDDFKDEPITKGEILKDYKGIGKKIIDKVDEIISEGHLKAADRVRDDKDIKIINDFKDGIYGVGITKATELVKELNIRSFDDLKERESEIMKNGRELLNNVQKKGLKHYKDSLLKIPRSEMIEHDNFLNKIATSLNDKITISVAGSYRRGLPSSGDIDVLIKQEDNDQETLNKFVNKLKDSNYIIEEYVYGDKKFQGMCKLEGHSHARRLDLLFTTIEEYPFALFYFTGSGTFNPKLRQIVMDKGYRLSEQGIYEIDDKKKIKHQIHNDKDGKPFRNEKDIFKFIDIPYIEPKNRNPDTLDKVIIE